ncbi:phosphotransferase [Candidatus Formimonas warabiya]|uniref:Homoserine kinase n=1 Tax=Formimonas warabiya TaxID=1761012 RepID=A0A3G1L3A8_FORW1|nr:phosphotransferase [Candidatus Formimonas warabiya]ATW28975.1 homoserine kinase [Candidatus Formimonas warabiya]
MDTSRMLQLTELNTNQLFTLFAQSEKLTAIASDFRAAMELSLVRNQIVDALKFYDLGTVTDVYEIFGGYINKSYGIYTEKDGKTYEYFVRKYKKGIMEKEMELEHSLIDFSIANGLDIAAGLIRTKDGKTFVKLSETSNGEVEYRYFAIYDFLSGEDKYTWVDPYLTDEEFASFAEVLATLHNASRHFDPKGRERVEPKILEFVPTLPKTFKEFTKTDINNKFHSYYLRSFDEIMEVIDRIKIPPEAAARMPYNPIHSDYHPGNVKFQDGKAVGIFDFDWAKIDHRLFDVCLALVYSCCAWEDLPDGSYDGMLRLDKCGIFLKAYQKKLKELGGLDPINETEKEYFPIMVAAANVYLINWCLAAYYAEPENLNVYEYLTYLMHQVRLMKWIEEHKPHLADLIKSI